MKLVSFTSVTLSALTLGALGLANAQSPSEFSEFATDLGLSETDIDSFVASFGGPTNRYVQDRSCQILKLLFPNITYLPGDTVAYGTKVSINWSMRAWLNGKCIFSPNTTHATAIGVKIAKFFGTQFAIRSGGHTPDPGAASTSEGILFSLENLNQIDVDTTKNIASIGPGNRWGDVYKNLETRGFVVAGGRVPPVGVGGLLTGGGLSYFSGTEGFSADTVKNYEVVLGDGRIVNANSKENPDLWWALKGGGNNFGIVTRFDMKAIPKAGGLVWGGSLYFLPDQYSQVLKAVAKFQAEGQVTDPKAAIITSFVRAPVVGLEISVVTVFHQDPTDTPPKSLQHFIDIGPVQNTAIKRTLSSLTIEAYGPAQGAPSKRQSFRDLSILCSEELYEFAVYRFNQTFAALDSTNPGIQASFTYQPISVAMADVGNATGGHPLNVPRKPQIWLSLNIAWDLAADDGLMISTSKKFLAEIEQKAAGMGLGNGFLYLNDASADQPVMKGYGEANLNRLQAVSKKFDPTHVFQKQVTGGFKLF